MRIHDTIFNDKELLTTDEVAEILDVSRKTIIIWGNLGRLPYTKGALKGKGHERIYKMDDILNLQNTY